MQLHLLGPRLELRPRGSPGPFVTGTAGLALTEGALTPRAGGGFGLTAGYEWTLGRWVALAAEAGGQGHVYGNGGALVPFVGLRLTFRASTE